MNLTSVKIEDVRVKLEYPAAVDILYEGSSKDIHGSQNHVKEEPELDNPSTDDPFYDIHGGQKHVKEDPELDIPMTDDTFEGQFRREHRKLYDEKKSGASPKKSTWFGYERMLFLLPVTESRGSSSTDIDSIPSGLSQTTAETEVESTETQSETIQQPKPKKMCNTTDEVSIQALQCMKSLTEAVTKRDSQTIFGEFISDSLRNSNRPEWEVNQAKQRITQIIFYLQNGVFANMTHVTFNEQYAFSLQPT